MKSIKTFFPIALIMLIALSSCKTHKSVVQIPVRTVERKVTTLVPIHVPGDSASLRAYFECDSLNNVLLKEISEKKGSNMSSEHSFKNGAFDYKATTHPDTVWIQSDTIFMSEEIPIEVEVPVVEIRMSKFQTVFFVLGLIASGVMLAWGAIKIQKLKIFKL